MPDNKLTDSEIMEALKHCANGEHCRFCCFRGITGTVSDCSKNFLDLINHLQAENERLKAKCENTQIGYNFAEDEIKNLKKDKYKLQKALNQSEDYRVIVKAEAYKEFADRLETKLFIADDNLNPVVTKAEIDGAYKELVGEDNGKEKE